MYDTSKIATLIRKKLRGVISESELQMLNNWASENTENENLLKELADEDTLLADIKSWLALKNPAEKKAWKKRLSQKTFAKIHGQTMEIVPKERKGTFRLVGYAASILFVIAAGVVFLKKPMLSKSDSKIVLQDLTPGNSRAKLTVDDIGVISLSEVQNGIVSGQNLTYPDGSVILPLQRTEVVYASLETPRGGQYQITLSDGTKVWLNADSKLTYPSRFTGESRVVELSGEAYFEVVSVYEGDRRKPFIVQTSKQRIEVIGTHFNVSAYQEDELVQTTLVEGVVEISSAGSRLLLQPGEQGVSDGQTVRKSEVDLSQYLAWKANKFVFTDTELGTALKMLGRWYDFDVVYEEPIQTTYIYGTISRDKNLTAVLKIMEAGGLRFRIEHKDGANKLIVLN